VGEESREFIDVTFVTKLFFSSPSIMNTFQCTQVPDLSSVTSAPGHTSTSMT